MDVGNECFGENGFYPISFSYPESSYLHIKSKIVADIIPGSRETYKYDDYGSYLGEYKKSYYGITHKKAGWDCFRHVEILHSNCIPLMQDAAQIPKYTMTHHPKELYVDLYERFQRTNEAPSEEELHKITSHFNNTLTTKNMIKYIFSKIGIMPKNVLFVDSSLPEKEDYLSMLTLIGLKQIYGQKCVEAFITPYLYDSYLPDTKRLYGLGFGYSRLLPASSISGLKSLDDAKEFDLVIVGNLRRNEEVIKKLNSINVPKVYLFGEDHTVDQLDFRKIISNLPGYTFVREI